MRMNEEEKKSDHSFSAGSIERGDVLLLVSPTAWRTAPLAGVHLLQASCKRTGIITRVLYTNLLYSALIGPVLHCEIAEDNTLFMGEHLFAQAAFNIPAVSRCLDKLSDPVWVPDHFWPMNRNTSRAPNAVKMFREWFPTVDWEHLESLTTDWTLSITREIAKLEFPIVGCSTTPGGLVPAIALLNGIKSVAPGTITILGGSFCHGNMAEGIASLNSGIDYIFSGEGEITFPDFVKHALAGHFPGEKVIYGETVMDLDTLPLPDYREYFQQIDNLSTDRPDPGGFGIPYETSRGCWYGKCTFCGLKDKRDLYRRKSVDKIIEDLNAQIKGHRINTVALVDNIMPVHYFNNLLPRLSREIPSINIRCEIKSNLTLDQVIALKKAGANETIPGIESLSSSLLMRMDKGVTVRENIAFLRWARSVGLPLTWSLLFGFPGDQTGEYEEMVQLFPLIHHLPPPCLMIPLRIFRFSRYHTSPETFGLANLRPAEIYQNIFPADADIEKIAYCFTADFPSQSHENPEVIDTLWQEFQAWQKVWKPYEVLPMDMMLPGLHITRKNADEYILEDTRGLPGRPKRMVLNRKQAGILLVPGPQDSNDDYQWALDAQLGVLAESWFIPLATADPELLLEFEREHKRE